MGNSHKFLFDGNKLLWHMDRVHAHYREGRHIYPLHIDIGATKLCNAKCVYCYGIHQEMTNEIIPRDVLMNLFKDAPTLGIKSLTVTGDGEPTLNPAIYDAIEAGTELGLDVGFATNGIALDDDKIHRLLSTCTWLRFNLSASGQEGYKSIHGVPQWERVQANIQRACELKKQFDLECTIGLQMVLIPPALKFVLPITDLAHAWGVDYFVIKQYSDPGCEEMTKFNLNWYDSPDTLKVLKKAEAHSTMYTKIVPKWGMMHSKGKRPYRNCPDCPLIFQISGNSKCYPCGYLFNDDAYCYGDLKKKRLKDILDSDSYWDTIYHMRHFFDSGKDCQGNCRHDFTNEFIYNYLNPPTHLNFI